MRRELKWRKVRGRSRGTKHDKGRIVALMSAQMKCWKPMSALLQAIKLSRCGQTWKVRYHIQWDRQRAVNAAGKPFRIATPAIALSSAIPWRQVGCAHIDKGVQALAVSRFRKESNVPSRYCPAFSRLSRSPKQNDADESAVSPD